MHILKQFSFGDVLRSPRGMYFHYGVQLGWDQVLQFAGDARKDVATAKIRISSMAEFADGNWVECAHRCTVLPAEVLHRARPLIDKRGYNLFSANCEHLAWYVSTGESKSTQVASFLFLAVVSGATAWALSSK